MRKTTMLFLIACLLAAGGYAGTTGHTEAIPEKAVTPAIPEEGKALPIEGTRAAKYPRLAFVCAPGPGADPKYVPMILREIESAVPKYLSEQNLQKVTIMPEATVNISTAPPTVQFKTINDYDAVAIITYTYSSMVYMDINLIDIKTGQNLYYVQLHAKPDNIELRLNKLAHIVPHRINKYFYRKG